VPDDHDPNQVQYLLKIQAGVAAQFILVKVDFLMHAIEKLYVIIADWKFLCDRLCVLENSWDAIFQK